MYPLSTGLPTQASSDSGDKCSRGPKGREMTPECAAKAGRSWPSRHSVLGGCQREWRGRISPLSEKNSVRRIYFQIRRGEDCLTGSHDIKGTEMKSSRYKKTAVACGFFGAQKKTRTSTTLRPQIPETCASTNSAIWAQRATGSPRLVKGYLACPPNAVNGENTFFFSFVSFRLHLGVRVGEIPGKPPIFGCGCPCWRRPSHRSSDVLNHLCAA